MSIKRANVYFIWHIPHGKIHLTMSCNYEFYMNNFFNQLDYDIIVVLSNFELHDEEYKGSR